jgi:hypothetical protein
MSIPYFTEAMLESKWFNNKRFEAYAVKSAPEVAAVEASGESLAW